VRFYTKNYAYAAPATVSESCFATHHWAHAWEGTKQMGQYPNSQARRPASQYTRKYRGV